MTEAEWLACDDPTALGGHLGASGGFIGKPANHRNIRLFACACCRRVWHLMEPHKAMVRCVAFAEGYADGIGSKHRLKKLADENRRLYERYGAKPGEDVAVAFIAEAARSTCEKNADERLIWACRSIARAFGTNWLAENPGQSLLFRDIFGNPFRPVTVDPSWRPSTVLALARQMYESRDFSPMTILADALQDAGCEQEDILAHCRSEGPHVRGCWVVDLLLGKE